MARFAKSTKRQFFCWNLVKMKIAQAHTHSLVMYIVHTLRDHLYGQEYIICFRLTVNRARH